MTILSIWFVGYFITLIAEGIIRLSGNWYHYTDCEICEFDGIELVLYIYFFWYLFLVFHLEYIYRIAKESK